MFGGWRKRAEKHRASKQQGELHALDREGNPRGGVQSYGYRHADPRELVEEDGVVMSGPAGASQEDESVEAPATAAEPRARRTILGSMTRLLLAATLALTTLVASSCGGGGSEKPLSKSDYEAEIGAIFRQLQGKTLPAVLRVSPADPERAVRRLKSAEKTLHESVTKLAEMKPPADATRPTSELASAFKQIADEVTAARKGAEAGNFLRLEQFKARVSSDPAVAQVRDAVIQLVNLGYEVAGGGP